MTNSSDGSTTKHQLGIDTSRHFHSLVKAIKDPQPSSNQTIASVLKSLINDSAQH